MGSTSAFRSPDGAADWHEAGLRYFARSFFFRKKFGGRVWKVSVDGGLDCPNRDGTLGSGGCVFCDPESFSPSRRAQSAPIARQIDQGIRGVRARHDVDRFVAYFQPATNTYAPLERLRELYGQALEHPDVVGLVIGTRPDCVGDDVLDLLAEISRQTWLLVEYGLQSIHDRSLEFIGRGHRVDAFLDACRRGRSRRLQVGAHVILGLPGESPEDMRATARELARLGVDAVKIHNLHAVRNTRLAEMVSDGTVRLLALDEYVERVVDFLEELPPGCVIDRLSGDAPREYLVGPKWCLDKSAVLRAIEAEFRRRGTRQGAKAS